MVKSGYGTKQVSPNTECKNDSTRAVGVLVEMESMGSKSHAKCTPLCGSCRDNVRANQEERWRGSDFRRFVDQ